MPGIAYAFARARDDFPETTIVLQDIDAPSLDLQLRLTRSILASRGAGGLRVEASAERPPAIDGADFVLTSFRPGGFPARHLDESIAIAHGIVGQETAGPGGFAMALRSIPIVMDVAGEIRKVAAPGCLLLNYTNPVQVVTEAVTRYEPDVPFLGLCDQTAGEVGFLARLLGVDPRDVEIDTSGTNHMTFTRAVRANGRDVTERVWDRLDGIRREELEDDYWWRVVRLFRVLRVIPSGYMEYFFFHDEVLTEMRAAGRTRAEEVMEQLPEVLESYRREADGSDPHPVMVRASDQHGDFAVSIMSVANAAREGRFILNVRNGGAVTDLPEDAAVEVPCRLMGRLAQPIAQGPLPAIVAGLVRQVAEHARLTAEAAVTGDLEIAVRAMVAHPLVRSVATAERLVDAYLEAHAAHLPQFARVANRPP